MTDALLKQDIMYNTEQLTPLRGRRSKNTIYLLIYDRDTVVKRLEEAGKTLLAMPNTGHSLAVKTYWPDVLHTTAEAYGWNGEAARPAVPSSTAIGRMDEAYSWVKLLGEDQVSHKRIVHLRSLVHPQSNRYLYSWRKIGGVFGWHHISVQAWHRQAIDKIVAGLNANPLKLHNS